MKNLIGLMIVFAIVVSCSKDNNVKESPEYPYLRLWAATNCGSLELKEDTPELWKDKVLDSLNTWDYNIIKHHLGYIKQDFYTGCAICVHTGDFLDVIVPDNQREKLKNLGFQE